VSFRKYGVQVIRGMFKLHVVSGIIKTFVCVKISPSIQRSQYTDWL
jgi:hypothetical protein